MIAELKPYPAMKDSGVEWLGEVPAHWGVLRLGNLLRERGEVNTGGSVQEVLSVLRDRGVIPYVEKGNIGNKRSEDITRYKVVRPDDIVVNCMNVIIGSVGLSRYTGCLSPVYYVLTRRSEDDDPRYLGAYFETKPFQKSLVRIGNGILAHRMRIPMELLKCELFLRPPLLEQTAIVRYLDYVGRRVRQFVKAKQKLIGLLEEQKQAIIHRAVTRGLDPDVSLKDSGIEWLGETPEHWEIQPLKYWVHLNKSVLSENKEADFEFKYLDIGSVGMGILTEKPQRIRFSAAPSRARRIVRSGDTLVSTVRTYLKAVWFADEQNDDLIASTGFAVLSPNLNTAPKYVSYLVQSDSFTNRVTAESVGIAYPAIPESKLAKFKVAIPPLAEQTIIVEHLNKATANIDAIIAHTRREIALLQEYHTRLTADVVTGKVDVRDIELPEKAKTTDPEETAGNRTVK